MRMLFELDKKDYNQNGSVFSRPSVRAIIIQNGKVAMIYSKKYNYYKFPGGGIEAGESKEDALIREVLEETGLRVIKHSIQEYGQVHRIQKWTKEDIFIQDNDYFLCEVEKDVEQQNLDEYEADEGFTLQFLNPQVAIDTNRKNRTDDFDQVILERETRVLELLMQEGLFDSKLTTIKFYEHVKDELLKFAVILSKSQNKYVFCKHKDRDTWEIPGGHREPGENITDTAKRELYEETGALEYNLKPVCVYSVTAPDNFDGKESFGMLYFADIKCFEAKLHNEIEKIALMDELPKKLTYPDMQPALLNEARKRGYL